MSTFSYFLMTLFMLLSTNKLLKGNLRVKKSKERLSAYQLSIKICTIFPSTSPNRSDKKVKSESKLEVTNKR